MSKMYGVAASALALLATIGPLSVESFAFTRNSISPLDTTTTSNRLSTTTSTLSMVLDEQMENRLSGIRRSYMTLTERLGDPDVLADSNLLMSIMKDRSKSEGIVTVFDEVRW